MMSFGSQLREYREEYLRITQKQMAEDLGVNSATISRYEADRREFPLEQLPLLKELYDIPDDMFLALILDRPLKTVRSFKGLRTLDQQTMYGESFCSQYADVIEAETELKEMIALAAYMRPEQRRLFLPALRSLFQLFDQQLRK